MDRWMGTLAIVVGAALFMWGPNDIGVRLGQWVLWLGGVVLLIAQPISFAARKWRNRGSGPRLRPKGSGYLARQVLRDQSSPPTPLFPPRNGDFAYADFEVVGARATNVRGQVTVKDSRGVTRYGPAPTLWAKWDSEGITLEAGQVGSLNSLWKPFDADAAYPVTRQALDASPMAWTDGRFRLEAGRYEVTLEAKGEDTNTATTKFTFEHSRTERPTSPPRR